MKHSVLLIQDRITRRSCVRIISSIWELISFLQYFFSSDQCVSYNGLLRLSWKQNGQFTSIFLVSSASTSSCDFTTEFLSIGLSFLADEHHSINFAQTEVHVCNICINTTANFSGALTGFLRLVKIMVSSVGRGQTQFLAK